MSDSTGEIPASSPLREVNAQTDLKWRVSQIPDTACCRGIFLNALDQRAGEHGTAVQTRYRRFFQIYKFSALRFYPVRDYITRIAVLSQIAYGSEGIYNGIRRIQRAAYPEWKSTLLGRAMFAIMGNDFGAVLKAIDRTYASHSFVNYCHFRVENPRPREYIAHFHPEYLYIEHAMLGALEGVAEVCDVRVQFDVKLTDPFNGSIAMQLG